MKTILLELALALSAAAASTDKKQYFVPLSFNSTLQLINAITCYPKKNVLRFFNGAVSVAFFSFPLA